MIPQKHSSAGQAELGVSVQLSHTFGDASFQMVLMVLIGSEGLHWQFNLAK